MLPIREENLWHIHLQRAEVRRRYPDSCWCTINPLISPCHGRQVDWINDELERVSESPQQKCWEQTTQQCTHNTTTEYLEIEVPQTTYVMTTRQQCRQVRVPVSAGSTVNDNRTYLYNFLSLWFIYKNQFIRIKILCSANSNFEMILCTLFLTAITVSDLLEDQVCAWRMSSATATDALLPTRWRMSSDKAQHVRENGSAESRSASQLRWMETPDHVLQCHCPSASNYNDQKGSLNNVLHF